GPSSIRSRIENSILLNPLSTVRAMVDMAGNAPPLLYDPAFKIGDFDWDVVPCDRLIGGC
ncbi:MAG TPA: hypothetical protein VFP68_03625, partial [Burkholderiaceae bacterium]|nr:hypothetical protein [Burkholderiaceae bacterium]